MCLNFMIVLLYETAIYDSTGKCILRLMYSKDDMAMSILYSRISDPIKIFKCVLLILKIGFNLK